jgi:hypothetical protein
LTFVIESYQSKGLRDDKGRKFVPADYFYNIENMNYDGITGCQRIKAPSVEYNVGSDRIDGMTQFRYIDSVGQFQTENICVQNGSIIKDFLSSPTTIYTGLTAQKKCTFGILNDKLFISNGFDYPLVYDGTYVKEMGAPTAKDLLVAGGLTGTYYYAMTYVIDGVEVVIGTVSNTITVSSKSIDLDIPVGVSNCTERKIYRTEAGGSTLKLVTTITDNTTLTYQDNIADGSLGVNIPSTNSSCPTPQFITVKDEKLIGAVNQNRPNYLYVSEIEVEVFFNTSGVYDVSGVGNDNTALTGMIEDYGQIVVFSERHIYIADTSGLVTNVQQTTSNVGCADGFSIVRVPENDILPGGIMFVSNLYDVRVFSGNIATNLATSFDNLRTNNYSISLNKDSFANQLRDNPLHAEFHDYKYHLIAETFMYVYDIRIAGWTKYFINTTSYSPQYWVFGKLSGDLYVAQKNAGIVEQMYNDTKYRNEQLTAFFETPEIAVDTDDKYFSQLYIYYDKSGSNTLTLDATINSTQNVSATISYTGAFYADDYYNETYYLTTDDEEDYSLVHINRYGKWMRFKITTQTQASIKGWKLVGRAISNKEL